jgi:hypothetical protein
VTWKVRVKHSEFENSYEIWLCFKGEKYKVSDAFAYECEDTKVQAWTKALKSGTTLERNLIEMIVENDI